MCLILFAHRAHDDLPLVVAANRDERYDRPTREAGFWPEAPQILAGKDLQAGGTWMGITRQGRFAAVTNFRDVGVAGAALRSRGALTRDFLQGTFLHNKSRPLEYAEQVMANAGDYAGFNLLLGDRHELVYCENLNRTLQTMPPGLYGLSNHLLDTPWPKVVTGKNQLDRWIKTWHNAAEADSNKLLDMLGDREIAEDAYLPDTGLGTALERRLSPIFIEGDSYGTCSSTAIIVDRRGQVKFHERSFYQPTSRDAVFEFGLESAAG